jgi:hypothetical protein
VRSIPTAPAKNGEYPGYVNWRIDSKRNRLLTSSMTNDGGLLQSQKL